MGVFHVGVSCLGEGCKSDTEDCVHLNELVDKSRYGSVNDLLGGLGQLLDKRKFHTLRVAAKQCGKNHSILMERIIAAFLMKRKLS